jgi:hypothetical protein
LISFRRDVNEEDLNSMNYALTDELFSQVWPIVAEQLVDENDHRSKLRADLCFTYVLKLIKRIIASV